MHPIQRTLSEQKSIQETARFRRKLEDQFSRAKNWFQGWNERHREKLLKDRAADEILLNRSPQTEHYRVGKNIL